MRVCLRCVTLVDTDVLLCMYLLLLLWCCCCVAIGCGVGTAAAALVHEGTEETCTYSLEKKRTRQYKSRETKEKLERSGT